MSIRTSIRTIPYAVHRQPKIARRCTHGVYWPSSHKVAYGCQLCNPQGSTNPTLHLTYVYFISAPEVGRIKVGITDDIEARLSALATGSPVRLELLGFLSAHSNTARKIEKAVHKRLSAFHWNREWFTLTPEVHHILPSIILRLAFPTYKGFVFEHIIARKK